MTPACADCATTTAEWSVNDFERTRHGSVSQMAPRVVLCDNSIDQMCDASSCTAACRALGRADVVVTLARPAAFTDPGRRVELLRLLSAEERQRLLRFRFDGDRLLYLVAHALVRLTLSRHSDVAARAWQFRASPRGRPEIADPQSPLRFSLSHTRGLAACAVAWERDVGIDVEPITACAPLEVAEQFFSAPEVDDLRHTPADRRARRFVEYWTLKEAYVKAWGAGLSLPLNMFSMHDEGDGAWRISFSPSSQDDPERWRFKSSEIAGTHQLAVAVACT